MKEDLEKYMSQYLILPHSYLDVVAAQHLDILNALPHVEPETGQTLHTLVLAQNAQQVLELGTCLGYSTIWLATALRMTGGKLLTVEKDEDLYWQARKNIERAGLQDVVEMVCADVAELLPYLHREYDIIFQDSRKNLYVPLLEECIRLVRPNGLIIADDTLLAVTNRYATIRSAVDAYNQKVFSDSRLSSVLIPVGDGLTVSVKI